MAVVNDTSFIAGDDHITEQRNAFTGLRQHVHDLLNRITAHDRDHPDTAIEGSKHSRSANAALMRQPFEHRKYRQPGEIDPHTESFGQYARNVVGEAASGDVGKPFHRAGFADRAQAGFDVKPGRG